MILKTSENEIMLFKTPFEDEICRELQWIVRLDSMTAHVLTAANGKLLVWNKKEYEEIEQLNIV